MLHFHVHPMKSNAMVNSLPITFSTQATDPSYWQDDIEHKLSPLDIAVLLEAVNKHRRSSYLFVSPGSYMLLLKYPELGDVCDSL